MNKLLLVVVLGLVVVLLPFTGTARAGTYKTSALWIGDSYTAGAGVSNPGQYGEGWLISRKLGWTPVVDGEGGTGFTNPGLPGFSTLPARLAKDRAISPDPSVVVIDAGRNDGGTTFTLEAATVRNYMYQVHRDFPRSKVLIITPWTMWGTRYDYAPLRCLLAEQARNYGFDFIDPIDRGWASTSITYSLMGNGTWHPSEAGYKYIADHLVKEIPGALAGKDQGPSVCRQVWMRTSS